MGVKVQLRSKQINQIASSVSLKVVNDYVKTHQKEYEMFLQEEQQKKEEKNNFTNTNSIWTFYTDDTICKAKLDNKKQ